MDLSATEFSGFLPLGMAQRRAPTVRHDFTADDVLRWAIHHAPFVHRLRNFHCYARRAPTKHPKKSPWLTTTPTSWPHGDPQISPSLFASTRDARSLHLFSRMLWLWHASVDDRECSDAPLWFHWRRGMNWAIGDYNTTGVRKGDQPNTLLNPLSHVDRLEQKSPHLKNKALIRC
jgi:hypothetical protein